MAAPGRRAGGRWEKAMSYKTHMYGGGESYSGVVPTKQPNEGRGRPQEVVEGRPLTKENMEEPNSCRTQSRESEPNGLDRVREAARKNGKLQFTALLHHVNTDLLRSSYYDLKKQAAAGPRRGSRGRDAGYPAPPAQTRAGATNAHGSYLG